MNFISKKRVRLRKASKFLLHTACQFCLSPYLEQANPITSCPECHTRGHNSCLELNKTNKCGKCLYSRLSNQAKQNIKECFICGVKHLGILKISNAKFVHTFCLLSHGIWRVGDCKVALDI